MEEPFGVFFAGLWKVMLAQYEAEMRILQGQIRRGGHLKGSNGEEGSCMARFRQFCEYFSVFWVIFIDPQVFKTKLTNDSERSQTRRDCSWHCVCPCELDTQKPCSWWSLMQCTSTSETALWVVICCCGTIQTRWLLARQLPVYLSKQGDAMGLLRQSPSLLAGTAAGPGSAGA